MQPPAEQRIKELGEKSTQILTFLSFMILATVTLNSDPSFKSHVLRFLTIALFPTLAGIVPLKELPFLIRQIGIDWQITELDWYEWVRWIKIAMLWSTIVLIAIGVLLGYRYPSALESRRFLIEKPER